MRSCRYLFIAFVSILFVTLSGCANVGYHAEFRALSMTGASGVPDNEFVPKKPNIVLVYGFTGTAATMLPMKKRMEHEGFNVLIPDVGFTIPDSDIMAKRLVEYLLKKEAALKERYGMTLEDMSEDILLFCHSQGGLICVNSQRMNRGLLTLPVVTAGTVYNGTPLAIFVGFQKIPGSPWLKHLREDMVTHPRNLLQITAESDEIIPASMNVIPDYPLYVAPFSGHMALLYELDPAVLKSRLPKHFPNVSTPKLQSPVALK